MNNVVKIALALVCWCLAGATGWFWHRPQQAPAAASERPEALGPRADASGTPAPKAMAARIAEVDPLGLNRPQGNAATATAAAAAASAADSWHVAALVVRGVDSYVVLTAIGQPPLRLKTGDTLPDGDRVQSIRSDAFVVRSPRGQVRTHFLIEP